MLKVVALLLIISAIGNGQDLCRRLTEECGGIQQHRCCEGQQLVCSYEKPIHPEAKGVCIKTCSGDGEICGGFAIEPQQCCEGYKCV